MTRKINFRPVKINIGAQIGAIFALSARKTVLLAQQDFIAQRGLLYLMNINSRVKTIWSVRNN